jgi:hypothetical protein
MPIVIHELNDFTIDYFDTTVLYNIWLINVLRSLVILISGDSDAKLSEQSCGVSKFTTWQYGTDRLGMFALSRYNENAEKREKKPINPKGAMSVTCV